jgi:Ser/Thr protein kinase RdoA (MazF antagonist)
VAGDRLTVIDFDDCGFSWHLYDLAAALSFIEAHPETGELVEAWLEGYQRRRRLPREHLLEIETLIMLRRLVLLAWLGTRAGTDLAETYAADFAEDSAVLAERFLTARG